jgi:hypothetical protein
MDDYPAIDNQQIFQTLLGLRPPSPSRATDGEKQGKIGRLSPSEQQRQRQQKDSMNKAINGSSSGAFSVSGDRTATTVASSTFSTYHRHLSSLASAGATTTNNNGVTDQQMFLQQHQQHLALTPTPLPPQHQHQQQYQLHNPQQQQQQQQQHASQQAHHPGTFVWASAGYHDNNSVQQQHQEQQPFRAFSQAAAAAAVAPVSTSSGIDSIGQQVHSFEQLTMEDVLQDLHHKHDGVVVDNPPPENPRAEDVDKITAVSLNELSMESREQVLYDLHGISKATIDVETADFLCAKLQALEVAIQHTPDKSAYDMAVSINPQYVADPAFRAKFLRAESYDVPRTAIRYIKHFQAKLELFDASLLCKDITQDDLEHLHRAKATLSSLADVADQMDTASEAGGGGASTATSTAPCPALQSLYSGWIQEFPVRDVAGRLCSVMSQQMLDSNLHVDDLVRTRVSCG